MYRELWIGLLCAGFVCAQAPTSANLLTLKLAAEAQGDAWEALSKNLATRTAGLLPCDPKLTAAINETKAASDSRLAAEAEYFRAALARASASTAAAQALLNDTPENVANGRFLEMERTEAERERLGVDSQISQIVASSMVRKELSLAEASLHEIAVLVDQRNLTLTRQVAFDQKRREALEEFAAQIQARETLLEQASQAFDEEAARWRAYYDARLDRTRAECDAISAPVRRRVAAPSAGGRKK